MVTRNEKIEKFMYILYTTNDWLIWLQVSLMLLGTTKTRTVNIKIVCLFLDSFVKHLSCFSIVFNLFLQIKKKS